MNGNLSQWNVSQVKSMKYMFANSEFNKDISEWNVSHVKDLRGMFIRGSFNGDISKWNVSGVLDMSNMFYGSKFDKDLSMWNNMGLANMKYMFDECNIIKPWWYVEIEDQKKRREEVKRRYDILKLNEKIEHTIFIKKDNIKKKIIKL